MVVSPEVLFAKIGELVVENELLRAELASVLGERGEAEIVEEVREVPWDGADPDSGAV